MNNLQAIGDYDVIKQIGQGSLGSVYLVEHRFIKKQFVLKVLPPELSNDRNFIKRFEEEIGKLVTINHPHIVKMHNISYAEGLYFLVTDCIVDGMGETTNLAKYMLARSKRLDEETLIRFLKQIATALDYAHQTGEGGFIHRNLKLNNILVGNGELFISDFGLSRIVGTGAVLSRTFKTVADALGVGVTIISPETGEEAYAASSDKEKYIPLHASFLQNWAFLAPEQKRLDYPQPISFKVDNYAFGILTYYLIMGEFPEGIFEMPSARVKEYSFHWDHIIQQCLQSDPEKRPIELTPLFEQEPTPQQYVCKQEALEPVPAIAKLKQDALRPIIRKPHVVRPTIDPDPAASLQVDTTVKFYQPETHEVDDIEPLDTEMIVIGGGVFWRGSNDGNRDEMPHHKISLSSYAIEIHPVTNEQFVRFLEVMGGEKDSNNLDLIRLRDSRIKRSGGNLSIESGYTKHPVVGVTWYGAVAYANWVGKRLPTEAEWEIAAKGGVDNVLFPTGDDIEKSQANFFSSDTTAVMSYLPNPVGLYDMAGNVYEWCHDWYGYNYYEVSVQEPDSPKGPLQGNYRVLRGGCWKSLKEDLRCSRRHRNNPGTVNGTYGFRCATDVQEGQ